MAKTSLSFATGPVWRSQYLVMFGGRPERACSSPIELVQPIYVEQGGPIIGIKRHKPEGWLIFGIYGATYMLYVTFIVTSMVDSCQMNETDAGGLWAWFGFLSIFSGVLFGSFRTGSAAAREWVLLSPFWRRSPWCFLPGR